MSGKEAIRRPLAGVLKVKTDNRGIPMADTKTLLNELHIDERARKSGGKTRWVVGLLLLALAVVAALFLLGPSREPGENGSPAGDQAIPGSGSASQSGSSQGPNGASASATNAVETGPEPALNASGYVIARRMATISSQVTGLITDVLVEEGAEVTAGQVVAKLDDTLVAADRDLAAARLQAAKASVATTRANLAEARRVLTRASDLSGSDFASRATLTRAQADVEVLEAELQRTEADVKAAETSLRRAEENLADHEIRAPFAGVVVDKNAQPGEMISPVSAGGGFTRTGVCTVVDMSSLEIEVDVNEAFIGRVFAGQRVEANLDAYPDWTIPASVTAIVPTANRDRATVRVRIGFDTLDPRILPEMGVRVAFFGTQS